ncbi:MAG: 3-phosphoshikimate 1-carboxyvinyltransferase, partial [Candidatus Marinimicrobia bacterium]|nr:3-phosphoshikimate 1-carboxyvinyltransferase [Candidatus Neomarinimicrobiota bacterium]
MSIKGTVTFPGDKSLSHRALIFAAMSNGESQISNLSDGNDVMSTRECLEHCGI